MSEVFDKSIRTLELPRVLKLLADQAVSPEAKELALAVRPEADYEDVLRLLDQTDGARTMMILHGAPGFSGVKPIRELLDRADRGRQPQYFRADPCRGGSPLRRSPCQGIFQYGCHGADSHRPDLPVHSRQPLSGGQDPPLHCRREHGGGRRQPELADIRRHMQAALARSRQILQKIISSPSYSKVLQDNIITQRDGRFVVPVKADQKGSLPGLVRDVSSTGATVFVEPMGVVQANNEYAELQARGQAEIDRILTELSADAATGGTSSGITTRWCSWI